MDTIYARCCGLDIHKRTVVACMIVPGSGRQSRKEIRTFGTMTDDLLALADWLAAEGVTHVGAALQLTGGRFQLLLVNARDVKQVPGCKTDVKDCEWIADLLRHGLLKGRLVTHCPSFARRYPRRRAVHHARSRGRPARRPAASIRSAPVGVHVFLPWPERS